ncbi:MAG: 2-hydroxyacid dehydrogenase [Stellaceae bacterium]
MLAEEDAILKALPVVLDPATPDEHVRAVSDFYRFDQPDFAQWLARLRQELPGLYPATVRFVRDEDELGAKIEDADALVVEELEVGEAVLGRGKRLKVVQQFGRIARNIDAAACFRHGVALEVQPRRVNVAVAEQAMALMLALAKRVPELNGVVTEAALRQSGFDPTPYDRRYTGNSNFARITGLRTLAGSALGIIGLGEIGRELAERGAAFGMTVLYHQRNRIDPIEEGRLKARYTSLDTLMAEADFIAPVLPLNDSTRGIVGRVQLARIKPGAMLVNVARAELVERAALLDALESGRLAGFALDVGYREPTPPDDPLLAMKRGNVILMPHTAPAERQNNLADLAEMCLKLWRGVTRPGAAGRTA